jgi:hypothetical protein
MVFLLAPTAISAQSIQSLPDDWLQMLQADSSADSLVQMRWLLHDGSILIVDKSPEISHEYHHSICIRWLPRISKAESEP